MRRWSPGSTSRWPPASVTGTAGHGSGSPTPSTPRCEPSIPMPPARAVMPPRMTGRSESAPARTGWPKSMAPSRQRPQRSSIAGSRSSPSRCAADPRTLDQRRADALAALTQGRSLACRCGQPDCPAAADDCEHVQGAARVVINVVASEHTVYADSDQPGYLEGYGIIDADQVRELAAAASKLIADPFTSPVEALRYQPSAALERAVRCRDLTCRFPGCSRPAVVCDIDHTIPFNHQDPAAGGPTVIENLKCLCRQH